MDHLAASRCALSRAIDLDSAKQTKEAVRSYAAACEHGLRALKGIRNDQERVQLVNRIREWLERAEELKTAEVLKTLPEPPNATQRISARKMEQGLESIAGLEHVKRVLREAILLPSIHPQLFSGERKPWRGLLMYGPPGTGKTAIASTIAKESGSCFFTISPSDIVSKYMGDSEKTLREVFEKARAAVKDARTGARAVIFIDEVDSIGRARGANAQEKESDVRLLTELLRQMDGLGADSNRILVIGATNVPQHLDSALRRRFERRLLVPLPGLKARAQILAKHLGAPEPDHSLSASQLITIAKNLRGFSGADISSFANELLLMPVRDCLSATAFARTARGTLVPCHPGLPFAIRTRMLDKGFDAKSLEVPVVTMDHVRHLLTKSRPSVNSAELAALLEFQRQYGEADEDAGRIVDAEEVSDAEVIAAINTVWRTAELSSAGLANTLVSFVSENIWSAWRSIANSRTLVSSG